MYDFIYQYKHDFVTICGFKIRPFRKKLVLSDLWNDLDEHKNNFDSLKKYLKAFKADLEQTTDNHTHDKSDQIPISGFYTPDTNRIELILGVSDYDKFEFNDDMRWNEFKFTFIQVLCHEVVHMMQFSNRDFSWSYRRCKYRKVRSKFVNEDRKYHASLDEIQAYAHCIFLEMMEFNINIDASPTYNMIKVAFGRRVNEPVIRKTLYHVKRWFERYNKAA